LDGIRPGTGDDAEPIARIQVAAWRAAYGAIMPAEHLAGFTVESRIPVWQKILVQGTTLVAETRQGLIGFCGFGPTRDHDADPGSAGEIYALYVDPLRWRSGAGTALCSAALADLTDQGFSTASLWVLADNAIGRSFYERVGFASDGTKDTYETGGMRLEELRYVKTLGS
jgi:ribosomal protein S18 acetylase RimI-like enzyme